MRMLPKKVLCLFGTRPEVIKFAPVVRQLERAGSRVEAVNVASGQHAELLYPMARFFDLRIHHDLHAMEPGQPPLTTEHQQVAAAVAEQAGLALSNLQLL